MSPVLSVDAPALTLESFLANHDMNARQQLCCVLMWISGYTMTTEGMEFLIFASEIVKVKCPKARIGTAALCVA